MRPKFKIHLWYYVLATLVPTFFIIGSLYSVIDDLNQTIKINKLETVGLSHTATLNNAIILLQKIRGINQIYWAHRDDKAKKQINDLQSKLVSALNLIHAEEKKQSVLAKHSFKTIQQKIEKIFLNKVSSVSAQALFDRQTVLIADVGQLVQKTAKDSFLIVEQDPSSHLLIELLVEDFPEMIESIGRMRGMGSGIIESGNFDISKRLLFSELTGGITHNLEKLLQKKRAILEESPTLHSLFKNFDTEVETTVKALLLYNKHLIHGKSIQTNSFDYFSKSTTVIQAISLSYETFHDVVQARFKNRLNTLERKRLQVLGLSCLGMVVMVLFISNFFLVNKKAMDGLELAVLEVNKNRDKLSYERGIIENTLDKINAHKPFDDYNLDILFKPVEKISGDLLFSTRRPDGVRHIFLGDFTGHGLASALGAPMVSEIFHRMTESGSPPLEILKEINTQLYFKLPTNLYLAAGFLALDEPKGELTIWNCGLPDFLHYHDRKLLERFSSNHMPLGILEIPQLETSIQVSYQFTDHFFLFTDGVLEVMDARGTLFGNQLFESLLTRILQEDLPMDTILKELSEYHAKEWMDDDITLIKLGFSSRIKS